MISGLPAGVPVSPMLPRVPSDLSKGRKAAQEFEAQLIATLLGSVEKTFAAVPGQDPVAGADNYNYLGVQALASALAAKGGFGIAHMISAHLEARK